MATKAREQLNLPPRMQPEPILVRDPFLEFRGLVDEEESLFPRLRALQDTRVQAATRDRG